MRRTVARSPNLLFPILVVLLAASCAGPALVSTGERGRADGAPAPVAAPAADEREDEVARLEAEAILLEDRARTTFQQGIDLHRAGRLYEAGDLFDEALVLLLSADSSLAAHPRIVTAFEEMVDLLDELTLEQAIRAEEERAASEILSEMEAMITPERAAFEAEVVAGASEEVTYDYPVVVNDQVLAWIDIYSGRMRESFARGLERSGWYLPMIRRIFSEEGIPADLCYLAHVESSYKPTAYSRAHAKGVFQFISATGRRYGLHRDWWIDERADPEKSARAAARYLRDLYDEFGDWYLAMAAYNGGEGRVRRAIARTGSRDFWELSRRRFFRRETRNYVPAILAATILSKNPGAYGFGHVRPLPPVEYDTVVVDTPTDLRVIAECSGAELEEIRRLNPSLYRLQTPPGRGAFEVHVPKGSAARFATAIAAVPVEERLRFTYHKVRQGDTLSRIARRYGTSIRALQDSNGMGRRTMIREGAVLKVPTSTASLAGGGGGWSEPADRALGEVVRHRVRRGETLSSLARRYRTTVAAIQRENGLSGTRIVAGRSLRITHGGPRSLPRAASASAGAAGTVVVRRGDSLTALARRHGTTVAALQSANGLGRSTRIYAGQTLRLPGSATAPGESHGARIHQVRRGDTLSRIARRYGTTIDRLCSLNGMRRSDTLYPGQTLRVAE